MTMADKEYIKRENVRKDIIEPLLGYMSLTDAKRFREKFERIPAADVRPVAEVNDEVDEALRVLNAIRSSGNLDYGDYCELHDVISAICGSEQEVGNG